MTTDHGLRFLRRSADQTGLDAFMAALGHGVHDDQVIAIILGSQEYLTDVLTSDS